MVNFKKLSQRAKALVEKRGGSAALKQDAEELKDIAAGRGSLADKAKAAAAAISDPGAAGGADPAERSAGEPAAGVAREGGEPGPGKPRGEGAGRVGEGRERD